MAKTGEKHLHLNRSCVLRLVQDHKGVGERAAAHEGERRNFNKTLLHHLLCSLEFHHVVKRIVEWAKVRVNFFSHITGEKPQLLSRFYRRTAKNDSLYLLIKECSDGHSHSKICLSGSRG